MSATYQKSRPFATESFRALQGFVEEATRRSVGGPEAFEDFERGLHKRMMAVEADIVSEHLKRHDVAASEIEVQGERYRRKGTFEKEYHALAGTFTIERSLYCPVSGRGRSVIPVELRSGVIQGAWTPLLARVMVRAVASTTPKEAAELFDEFGGARPSTSSLDRLPKSLSEVWELQREFFEEDLRCKETIPAEAVAVGVCLDGVLVPMKPEEASPEAESDDKPVEGGRGPRGYQEAACGTVSLYDSEGRRLETVRYARAPEHKKKTLKTQLEEELSAILAVRPDLILVCLSDGAEDHWRYLRGLAERVGAADCRMAADLFHVLERVKKALDAYYGEGTVAGRAAFEQLRIYLREQEDGVDQVLRALRYRRDRRRGSRRKTIAQQIKYIENRKKDGLLGYKDLLDAELPVGSGVVEAACKTLATERLKRSGMSWRPDGVQAILTFRSLIQSDRFSRAWEMIARQYRVDVVELDGSRTHAA